MSEEIKLIKHVQSVFKLNGFAIRSELCAHILQNWDEDRIADVNTWVDSIIDNIRKQTLEQSNLTAQNIELAVKECLDMGIKSTETVLNVISAFKIPKYTYNLERKKFLLDTNCPKSLSLFPDASVKGIMFRDRYNVVKQRVLRNELFKPTVLGNPSEDLQLQSVETLLSSAKKQNHAIVLGLLTTFSDGKYYLEDTTGALQLDMSEARFHTGLFTENCFLLCDGIYEDKVLRVRGIAHPPPELSIRSRSYFGDMNTFGGPSHTSLKNSKKLLELEKKNLSGIVFISDIWLDRLRVLQKLKIFFEGYNDCAPIAFVFLGNYLSGDSVSQRAYELKALFKGLGELIAQYKNLLTHSTFIFVPGKSDPPEMSILPRAPIPKYVVEDFQKKVPNSIFTTNPCRIQYCTQEIIVLREDLLTKMFRNTIHFPDRSDDISEHFMKTVIGQGHLAPFTLNVMPVYWCYDYALSLFPLPDLLVIADKYQPFSHTYKDCTVLNPGSFSSNDFSFTVYYPATKETDDSFIPPDV